MPPRRVEVEFGCRSSPPVRMAFFSLVAIAATETIALAITASHRLLRSPVGMVRPFHITAFAKNKKANLTNEQKKKVAKWVEAIKAE